MKKLIAITLALVMALSLAACGGGGNGSGGTSTPPSSQGNNNTTSEGASIVNAADEAWVNTNGSPAYIFKADGTYTSYQLADTWVSNGDGTYTIDETSLTLDGTTYPVFIDGNSFTLTISGNQYTYEKTQPFTPSGEETPALEHDEKLVLPDGQAWVMEDIILSGYIFHADGTYEYYAANWTTPQSEGTWSTSGDSYTETNVTAGAITKTITYEVSDGKLIFTQSYGSEKDVYEYIQSPIPSGN